MRGGSLVPKAGFPQKGMIQTVKFFTWFDLTVEDRYYRNVLPFPTLAGLVLIVAVLAVGYFAVRRFI